MNGHGEKLSRKQEQAIAALLTRPTVKDAAAVVGVAEVTLWRWMKRAEFEHAYRLARSQVVEQAVAQLQAIATEAVEALVRNLACGIPSAEIRAAGAVLDWAVKGIELMDLEERIGALEVEARGAA